MSDKVRVIYDGRLDDWSLPLFDLRKFDGILVRDHEVLKTIMQNQDKFMEITKKYSATKDMSAIDTEKRIS